MPLLARIVSNTEQLTVITGRSFRADGSKPPVVWGHSAGGDHLEPWLATNNCLAILEELAEGLGMPIAVPRMGGVLWGNDTAQQRITDAVAYLRTLGAHATKPPILLGVSMGGMSVLNWGRANSFSAMWLAYPATHLQAIHDGTGGAAAGGAASTEAAYGGSLAAFNAAVVAHDPGQNAGSYTGKPIRMEHSSADTTVGTANQTAFVSGVGGSKLTAVNLGAKGHADMTAIDHNAVRDFVKGYT